jgi:hypothetical protein
MDSVMAEKNILDFLSSGAWDEAGRAIEVGYRAPLRIGPRLVMAIVVTIPLLLLPLLGHAFLSLVLAWMN